MALITIAVILSVLLFITSVSLISVYVTTTTTTQPPTTRFPTTLAPTTLTPTTLTPTTIAPTTIAPTTLTPTHVPTTLAPTTLAPTVYSFALQSLPEIVKYDPNTGVQRTPVLGFNGWFWSQRSYDAAHLIQVADDFANLGYLDAGYDLISNDGGWWNGADWAGPLRPYPIGATTAANMSTNIASISLQTTGDFIGATKPDPLRFPDGMVALIDAIHARGFRYAHYHNAGSNWCNGQTPSGYGRSVVNIAQFAAWNVDYLKLDGCSVQALDSINACSGSFAPSQKCAAVNAWVKQNDAIAAPQRKMLINNCRNSCMGHVIQPDDERCDTANIDNDVLWRQYWNIPEQDTPPGWCNITYMARTSSDTRPCWGSMMNAIYAGLHGANGQFYDPDSLLIGLPREEFTNPTADTSHFGIDFYESQTQMGLFSIMSYPILIATDVSVLPAAYADIVKNPYALWINQNIIRDQPSSLRKLLQGTRLIPSNPSDWLAIGQSRVTVWYKPLDDDLNAVLILNQANQVRSNLNYNIDTLLDLANAQGLMRRKGVGGMYQVFNVWTMQQMSLGCDQQAIMLPTLESHQSHFVLIRPC